MEYVRLKDLQDKCFRRGKRRWAHALGVRLREFLQDNPQYRNY